MSDFQFIHNPGGNVWTILAPRRAKRPDQATANKSTSCPFCPGTEANEITLYRVGGKDNDSNWNIRVLANKYPFAPIHEVIIHSPDHHKNFDELPLEQVELIINTYKQRYNTHKEKGTVYIFTNFGQASGESLPHPHSQLVVIPKEVDLQIPPLAQLESQTQHTDHFVIFCPITSQWPDEVWVAPLESETTFGQLSDLAQRDVAFTMKRLIEIFTLRHGHEFPFNFYIYPYRNWYIRLIPRQKRLGGFELGTNVDVNTQDPTETIAFIQEHFVLPNREKILKEHQALYHRGV